MRKMQGLLTVTALLLLLFGTSCGDVTPVAGTITFVPASVNVQTSTLALGTQLFTVSVADSTNLPIQGIKIRLFMLLHNHLPFANAPGVVAFLDESGNPLTIAAPDGSSAQGTSYEATTDENGNITFTIQYPQGAAYNLEVRGIGVRSTGTATITLTTGA